MRVKGLLYSWGAMIPDGFSVSGSSDGHDLPSEPVDAWHPNTERPKPGEYLVCFRSGKMQTAKWEHTEYEPAGEWVDEDGDSLEDYDGQVVAYWRSRPVGPGEVG